MDFHLPELGEGVYEAEMARWLVKEGDEVSHGQGLLEVLTDKATMALPAPFEGTIDALRAREGEKLKVGDVVLVYHDKTESARREAPLAVAATVATDQPAPRSPSALLRTA